MHRKDGAPSRRAVLPGGDTSPSRRAVLQGLGVAGLGALAGCSLGPDRCAGGPIGDGDPAVSSYARLSGVETIVVVMMENRSFDHLLGGLRLDTDYPARGVVDGLRGDESNVDADGRVVQVARMPGRGDASFIPKHDFASVRATFNDGRNDGFVRANGHAGPHVGEVMGYLARDQVPFFYALADSFTVCDRWFSSYMGQTWPNRYYLHATSAGGRRTNRPLGFTAPPTIWERMGERCRRTKNYGAGPVLWYPVAFPAKAFSGNDAVTPASIESFFQDARRGELPELAVIDPDFFVNDCYPQHDLGLGEAFVASIYRALAESPQWSRSLLLVLFDEHGGFFDHVPPPTAVDPRPDFRQLGFRVPAFVIGPTVRRGAVVSTPLEHSALAATLRTRFGIESLGPRMDAAQDLSGCIDPGLIGAPASAPPALPPVELSERWSLARPVRPTSQTEVEAALAAGDVPAAHVDARSADERLASWLRHAQELAAVKVVP